MIKLFFNKLTQNKFFPWIIILNIVLILFLLLLNFSSFEPFWELIKEHSSIFTILASFVVFVISIIVVIYNQRLASKESISKEYEELIRRNKEEADKLKRLLNNKVKNRIYSEYFDKINDPENKLTASEIDEKVYEIRRIEYLNFQENCSKVFTLNEIKFENAGPFKKVSWELQPGVNILLGRNGYGKTYLMRMMVGVLQDEGLLLREKLSLSKSSSLLANVSINEETNNYSYCFEQGKMNYSQGKIPILAIPDTRFLNRSINYFSPIEKEEVELVEYGAYHFLHQLPYEDIVSSLIFELCLDYFEKSSTDIYASFSLITKTIENLTGEKFTFEAIDRIGRNKLAVKVQTEGQIDPVPIQTASQGTLSILAIFGTIYSFLKSLNPDKKIEEISKQASIVFIDEIDAHLHPLWQKKIVRLLRETFPNVQFILTAHSPLVVAGCLNNEVSVLRKEDNEHFKIDQIDVSFIDASVDEMYKTVFDIEEINETLEHYSTRPSIKSKNAEQIRKIQDKIDEKEDLDVLERKEYNKLLRENRVISEIENASNKILQGTKDDQIVMLKNKIKELTDKLEKI